MNPIHTVGGSLYDLICTPPTYQVGTQPMYVPFQLQPQLTLEERNEVKRQAAIKWLGTRWILHPENKVGRVGDV
jgi:hypothetical protein